MTRNQDPVKSGAGKQTYLSPSFTRKYLKFGLLPDLTPCQILYKPVLGTHFSLERFRLESDLRDRSARLDCLHSRSRMATQTMG